MKNLRIKYKIILTIMMLGLLSVVLISYLFYFSRKKSLTEINFEKLDLICSSQKLQVEEYYNNLYYNVEHIAETKSIEDLFLELDFYKDSLKIRDNQQFNISTPKWNNLYQNYNSQINGYITQNKYYDVYCVNMNG